MLNDKSTLDLTRISFGGAHCGILVYEENNSDGTDITPGLYLAARIQGGEHRREGGIVDIVLMVNGKPVPYTYEATPTMLILTAAEGEVNLIIDTDDTARIFGKGVAIKLYTKFPFYSMMNASILTGDLLDLNLGGTQMNGGRYIMKPNKGKPVCYSVFNPSTNGPDDAQVELHPDENGELDFEVYTMNPDEWGHIDYIPVEDAYTACTNKFEDFKACYSDFPAKYSGLKDLSVYAVWLHKEKPNGNDIYPTMTAETVYTGQLAHGWANAFEQPLHAMALNDIEQELKLLKNMYLHMKNGMLPGTISTTKVQFQATPPTQGVAVLDLLKKSQGKLDIENTRELYDMMKENYSWWKISHSFGEYRFSYNHRDELCLKGASYNALSFPLETPDLYTLMISYAKALAKLAVLTGDGEAAWTAEADGLKKTLLSLWNGASFDCRSVISGERFTTKSLLAHFPVILGDDLPGKILDKISQALAAEFLFDAGFASESKLSRLYNPAVEGRGAVVMWLQELIIYGLYNAGKNELANIAAGKILDYALSGRAASVIAAEGEPIVFRPGDAINGMTGSALIYIAGKLQLSERSE